MAADHFKDDTMVGTRAVGPAGTIVVADWSILHRRAAATATDVQRHSARYSRPFGVLL